MAAAAAEETGEDHWTSESGEWRKTWFSVRKFPLQFYK